MSGRMRPCACQPILELRSLRTPSNLSESFRIRRFTATLSDLNNDLEPAINHAPGVKGHRRPLHHLCHTWVLHDFCVHTIAVGSRLEDDPGEHHSFARL